MEQEYVTDYQAEVQKLRVVLEEVRRDRDAEREARREAQRERDEAQEALRLITTWTSPKVRTPETVQAAHDEALRALGLSDS